MMQQKFAEKYFETSCDNPFFILKYKHLIVLAWLGLGFVVAKSSVKLHIVCFSSPLYNN